MHLVEPDILLEPCIRKIHAKGWYTKFHYVTSRSGRLGRAKKTVIEFFTDAGIPNDTAPEDFEWKGNVLTSIFPESDDMSNLRKLSEWVRNLRDNEEDDPLEFPEDFAKWLEIRHDSNKSVMPLREECLIEAEKVISIVAEHFDISLADIKSRSRSAKVVKARQIAVYLLQEICELKPNIIARILVYQDHATIIYAYHKCQECMENDFAFAGEVESISNKIREEFA